MLQRAAFCLLCVVVLEYPGTILAAKKISGCNTGAPGKVDQVKCVSSDKVRNGGRKGATSGNWPLPHMIPFPVIPLKGQGSSSSSSSSAPSSSQSSSSSSSAQTSAQSSSAQSSAPSPGDRKRKQKQKAEKGTNTHHRKYSLSDGNRESNAIKNKIKNRKKGKSKLSDKKIAKLRKNTLTRLKRTLDDDDDDDGDININDRIILEKMRKLLHKEKASDNIRFKRSSDEPDELTDEEIKTGKEWLSVSEDNAVPGVETSNIVPDDFDFIWEGHNVLKNAYQTILPSLREIDKRSVDTDDDFEYDDSDKKLSLNKRDIGNEYESLEQNPDDLMFFQTMDNSEKQVDTREISADEEEAEAEQEEVVDIVEGVDYTKEVERDIREANMQEEPILSVGEAQSRLENAEKAAKALTNVELQLGLDPENIVTNTHKYVEHLQAEKAKNDVNTRAHIVQVHETENKVITGVHDELVKKSEINNVAATKRQLSDDRKKNEEIDTELKELKDIELMATGLELAKYLAQQRAQHNLDVAQSKASLPPQPMPIPTYQYVPSVPVAVPYSAPYSAPMQASLPYTMTVNAPVVTPMSTFAPVANNYGPIGGVHYLPNTAAFVAPHQMMATQRHEASRPPSIASSLPLPHTHYFSSYLKPKNIMENQFARYPSVDGASHMMSASPYAHANMYGNEWHMPVHTAASSFYPPQPAASVAWHARGDQRHLTPSPYMFQPGSSVLAPVDTIASFARAPKPNHVGKADHEIMEIEQSHKTPQEEEDNDNSNTEESNDTLGGMLSFPGTTYSPPPSWAQRPIEPSARHDSPKTNYGANYGRPAVPVYNNRAPVAYQPRVINAQQQSGIVSPVPMHFAGLNSYHSPQPFEALVAINPVQQFSQQSSLSAPAVSSYYASSTPPAAAPNLQQITTYQNNLFPEHEVNMRPGVSLKYVDNQQANAGEVIKTTPPDEVVTVNKPKPAPQQSKDNRTGTTLPGYMGAVDTAKYGEDVSDRLRQKPSVSNSSTKGGDTDPSVKREYLDLAKAEGKKKDTAAAVKAVTHIETAVGFDPGSVAKMVDFVKTAAVKDVQLSKETVSRDQEMVNEIIGQIAKRSEITSKPDETSVALKSARSKLVADQAVLADAKDRLGKINQMELILTEIEVAKFYATMKADKDVVGAKRTLEAVKSNVAANRR